MGADSWTVFHRNWSRFKLPLRPDAEVAAVYGGIIKNQRDKVLLLGVTPELSALAANMVALDMNPGMIANVWPGDTQARRAVQGSWLAMPLQREFTAAIGDGAINALTQADHAKLFSELKRVLLPGARLAVRIYATPDDCESLDELRAATLAGNAGGFHAFKWRLAMAIAAGQCHMDVPVDRIHQTFQALFPDRDALGRAAGWSADDIAEIDLYAGLATCYSFPRRDEILAALPQPFTQARFVSSGTYALAERCPILVADVRP